MTTVVLGYVPKPEGEAALTTAIDEARLRGARLVVVNSHRGRPGDPATTEAMGAELDDVRRRVEGADVDCAVEHPQTELEPAEDLLAAAVAHDADLLVIGLRRRSPVGKLILGTSAQRILLDAPCPVLAVTTDATEATP